MDKEDPLPSTSGEIYQDELLLAEISSKHKDTIIILNDTLHPFFKVRAA